MPRDSAYLKELRLRDQAFFQNLRESPAVDASNPTCMAQSHTQVGGRVAPQVTQFSIDALIPAPTRRARGHNYSEALPRDLAVRAACVHPVLIEEFRLAGLSTRDPKRR